MLMLARLSSAPRLGVHPSPASRVPVASFRKDWLIGGGAKPMPRAKMVLPRLLVDRLSGWTAQRCHPPSCPALRYSFLRVWARARPSAAITAGQPLRLSARTGADAPSDGAESKITHCRSFRAMLRNAKVGW